MGKKQGHQPEYLPCHIPQACTSSQQGPQPAGRLPRTNINLSPPGAQTNPLHSRVHPEWTWTPSPRVTPVPLCGEVWAALGTQQVHPGTRDNSAGPSTAVLAGCMARHPTHTHTPIPKPPAREPGPARPAQLLCTGDPWRPVSKWTSPGMDSAHFSAPACCLGGICSPHSPLRAAAPKNSRPGPAAFAGAELVLKLARVLALICKHANTHGCPGNYINTPKAGYASGTCLPPQLAGFLTPPKPVSAGEGGLGVAVKMD